MPVKSRVRLFPPRFKIPTGYGPRSNYSILGGGPILNFSDPLQTVDPFDSTSIKNWITGNKGHGIPVTDPVGFAHPVIGVTVFDGANGFVWLNASSGAISYSMRGFATPIMATNLYKLNHFCQCTLLTVTGGWQSAVAVGFYAPDSLYTGYHLNVHADGSWVVQKGLAEAFTTLASAGAGSITTPAILRLSYDTSVANQITITAKNGSTQLAQVIDNTNPILVGGPAMINLVPATSGNSEWRTFSCGLGL